MVSADTSVHAVAYAGAAAQRPIEPPPQQRVVESTAQATLQQQQTASMYARMPSPVQDLVASARQFADILDRTGNVQVASSVSGFRVGFVDTYA